MSQKGLKQILIELLQKEHLLSVSSFLQLLKKNGRTYNKTSVYRALDQLLDEGVVCRHHFSTNEATYEFREHHHAHLVCTSCDKIQTSECSCHEPQQVGSFMVDHHHTTLFGVCESCQE